MTLMLDHTVNFSRSTFDYRGRIPRPRGSV
jgi:hypothetical protein